MKTTNAIDVRRSLGRVLAELEDGGEPVVVERTGKPVAVLVSIRDFRERFGDATAREEREALVEEILRDRPKPASKSRSAVASVRALRGRLP